MHTDEPVTNERAIIAVLALAGMLVSLQLTLMIPALPDVPEILGITSNDASWLVTITLLTSVVGTPIVSRMADMYGRRRLLLLSLALLTTGSVVAALGMEFTLVLVGRAFQGFGAAIIPIGVSLMRDLLTPHRAAKGIALLSGTMGIGSAIGLPLSGVLLEYGGLSSIFWTSAIGASIFFILVRAVVPDREAPAGGRFDLPGTLIFTIALASLLLLISKGAQWGASPITAALLFAAAVGFAVWIPHQLSAKTPLVHLRSSFVGPALTTNIASFFAAAGMFANYLLTIQEAHAPPEMGMGLGMSTMTAGLLIVPSSVMMVALSPMAARVLINFGGKVGLIIGSGLIFMAYAFRFFFHDGLMVVLLGTMFVGVGATFAFAAMPTLIMDAVPAEQAAAANGLNSLIRNLAGAVTTAAYGLLFVLRPWAPDPTYLSQTGILTGFAVMAACAFIAMAVAFLLPGRTVARG